MKTLNGKLLLVLILLSLVLSACAPNQGDTVVLLKDEHFITDYNTWTLPRPGCDAVAGSQFIVGRISSYDNGGAVGSTTVYWLTPKRVVDGDCSGGSEGKNIEVIKKAE